MSWFSDLFGRDQAEDVSRTLAAAELAAERERVAEEDVRAQLTDLEPFYGYSRSVCRMCGGSTGVECPNSCGGDADHKVDCACCGGYGAVPCPACVCTGCMNERVVPCPAGCSEFDEDCEMCGGEGVVACPMCPPGECVGV